jgi:hypothetical protein
VKRLVNPRLKLLDSQEESYVRIYELVKIIEEKKDYYFNIAKKLYDTLALEKVDPRTIGCMVGALSRGDDDLNKRLKSMNIGLDSAEANRIRDIVGMKVLEDP